MEQGDAGRLRRIHGPGKEALWMSKTAEPDELARDGDVAWAKSGVTMRNFRTGAECRKSRWS